jgi:hypothetical protein
MLLRHSSLLGPSFGFVFSLVSPSTRDLRIGSDIGDAHSQCFQQCIVSRTHVSRGIVFSCRQYITLGCSSINWLHELRLG